MAYLKGYIGSSPSENAFKSIQEARDSDVPRVSPDRKFSFPRPWPP